MRWVRHRLSRRGSYFFVIDATIATIVIVGTLLALYGSRPFIPTATPAFAAADDYLGYLTNSEVGAFDDPQVRAWVEQGVIADARTPIIRQLALFNASGRGDDVRTLAGLTLGAVSPQIGVDLRVAGQSYANRSAETADAAPVMVVAKRIVVVRNSTTALAQPVVVEVRTWQ